MAGSTVLATTFLIFFSSTTSFLNPWFGGDSAIFRMIGTAMAHGKSLYVEIWDHKGPAMFAIQWLAQVIWPGRNGIFLIQVVSLTVTLVLFGLVARRFLGPVLTSASLVAFLALLVPLYESGNLTEEYSLPFTMFVVWALTRPFHEGQPEASPLLLALSGVAFGIVVFIRLNNSAGIIAAFVAYFIFLLVTRRKFVLPLLISIGGFAAGCGIFIVWFTLAGSLPEMIHATFTFNFEYAKHHVPDGTTILKNGYLFLVLGYAALTMLGGLVDAQRNARTWYLILSASFAVIGSFAVLSSTTGFYHYLQLLVPGTALGVVLILQLFTGPRALIAGITVVALSAGVSVPFYKLDAQKTTAYDNGELARQAKHLLEHVPVSERNEIFTWNLPANYFFVTDTLPPHRFFMLQDWWASVDRVVIHELREYFDKTPPRWVLTPREGSKLAEFNVMLAERYTQVEATGKLALHRLKE
ncbi:hypothetical protein JD292_06115 [Leucobacter sp. CSA2]|uniref:Glycosyltransferase RgtA/B/C/D-like domain-containing protein n=1 Tax=Leucobacter edaphi TaxID=2796472 RepID=A0A934QD67_9MICO|nr:hypothetical protein [Leucobacter edaphi]MBK0421645.1 hypothetical protein [Leucobacter edaphi]